MNIFFDNLFGKKSKTKGEVEIVTSSENKDIDTQSGKAEKWSVAYIEDLTSPIVAGSNYLTLFSTIPEVDRKSTRLNSSHTQKSRMPSSA